MAGWLNAGQEAKLAGFLEQCNASCGANGDAQFCTAYCSCALDVTVRDNLWNAPAEELGGLVELCTAMAR